MPLLRLQTIYDVSLVLSSTLSSLISVGGHAAPLPAAKLQQFLFHAAGSPFKAPESFNFSLKCFEIGSGPL
jgi:hypothetical protein